MPGPLKSVEKGTPGYGTMLNTDLHHRVDALERDLNQRTLVPSPRIKSFIEKTNRLKHMFIPQSYTLAIILCFITMICWGSWGNTQKLTGKSWRFELFYWDYALGILLFSILIFP